MSMNYLAKFVEINTRKYVHRGRQVGSKEMHIGVCFEGGVFDASRFRPLGEDTNCKKNK